MEKETKKISPKLKRTLINVFLLLDFSLVVIALLVGKNADEIIDILPNINIGLLLLTCAVYLLIYLIEGYNYLFLCRKYDPKTSYLTGLILTSVGYFFAGITPGATGGQVGQIYVLNKKGIKMEQGASLLVLQWIAKEIAVIIFSIFTIWLSYVLGYNNVQSVNVFNIKMNFIVFAIIGFSIHALFIAGVLFLSYSPKIVNMVFWCIKVMHKLHLVNDEKYDAWNKDVINKINLYRKELKDLKHNWKYFFNSLWIEIIRLLIIFVIPFFVALTLGIDVNVSNLPQIIVYASFVHLISTFIPIPGASGGTEAFFAIIFGCFFVTKGQTTAALLVWRFVTFYLGLIIGLITVLVYNKRTNTRIIDESLPSKKIDEELK